MPSFDRIDRISQEVHKAIDSIIRDDLNDPRIGGTWSVVRCEVTRDLRYCKVRVSILEQPDAEQQQPQSQGEMPSSGSYEDWYNYFFPFFGGRMP